MRVQTLYYGALLTITYNYENMRLSQIKHIRPMMNLVLKIVAKLFSKIVIESFTAFIQFQTEEMLNRAKNSKMPNQHPNSNFGLVLGLILTIVYLAYLSFIEIVLN